MTREYQICFIFTYREYDPPKTRIFHFIFLISECDINLKMKYDTNKK